MNVREALEAPVVPPDMGASTKWPAEEEWMEEAMPREVVGSMVEVSMKRREECEADLGRDGRAEERMVSKTPWT